MKICILADNQFVTNYGLSILLRETGIESIFQVRSRDELQDRLKATPDALVVLDYTLFDFVSVDQMLNVRAAFPASRWLLFSNELGEHFLRHTLLSDSTFSIVMKTDSKEEITNALRSVSDSGTFICESANQILRNNNLINITPHPVKLTPSEKSILHDIAMGKTTKEIAIEKFLSFHTVNTHRKNIFRKLGVNNVHEAVRYAVRAGVFDVAEYYI